MIVLLYHDIVDPADAHTSGFVSADADHYKISPGTFEAHLRSVAQSAGSTHFSFDDGGTSALHCADLLEARGFRGIFFIPTDFIGTTGFCHAADLRDLAARGHTIGSHSASHPVPISVLGDAALDAELTTSRRRLEDIVGHEVRIGSVPGGFTSSRVEQAAANAGYLKLYTSAPTRTVRRRGEMRIYGRFSITRSTATETIQRVAAGSAWPWVAQSGLWTLKGVVKSIGGKYWLEFRRRYFRRTSSAS